MGQECDLYDGGFHAAILRDLEALSSAGSTATLPDPMIPDFKEKSMAVLSTHLYNGPRAWSANLIDKWMHMNEKI